MNYSKFGDTDLRLSAFGFGASPFGDIYRESVTVSEAKKLCGFGYRFWCKLF